MKNTMLFWPVLAQIGLTIVLFFRLAAVKTAAAKAGQVDEARRALHGDAWPDNVIQVANNIRNQFELPVIFYVLIVILWVTNGANIVSLASAWLFVLARMAHAAIHTGSNVVPRRLAMFKIGTVAVIVLFLCAIWSLANA